MSQVKLHEKYGGVFPNLAKREHTKNIVPLLKAALEEAGFLNSAAKGNTAVASAKHVFPEEILNKVSKILEREGRLYQQLIDFVSSAEFKSSEKKPPIDRIAVTVGPGLEPALWVGLNTAKALGLLWNIPVIPVNHMEGHICSVLLGLKESVKFPAIALLVSGGHTELVYVEDWMKYKIVGETRDDAVGEAFDKVARMLGLPYPGGPEISRLAEAGGEIAGIGTEEQSASDSQINPFHFPRPMMHSGDLDFSFAGLKTAVLYTIKKIPAAEFTEKTKRQIAKSFQDAVVEVLLKKTERAFETYEAQSLIIAGGVISNRALRKTFENFAAGFAVGKSRSAGRASSRISLFFPAENLSGDNAVMIALCGYIHASATSEKNPLDTLKVAGNLRLGAT